MANQFDTDLKFEPTSWEAWDEQANVFCRVDEYYEPSKGDITTTSHGSFRARWRVVDRTTREIIESGNAASPTAARRKCRESVRRLRAERLHATQTANPLPKAKRRTCPRTCACLCHDTQGGAHDHPGKPCPGKQ